MEFLRSLMPWGGGLEKVRGTKLFQVVSLSRSHGSSLAAVQGARHHLQVRNLFPERGLDCDRNDVIDFCRLAGIRPATDHRGSAVPQPSEIFWGQATELLSNIEIAQQGGLDQRCAALLGREIELLRVADHRGRLKPAGARVIQPVDALQDAAVGRPFIMKSGELRGIDERGDSGDSRIASQGLAGQDKAKDESERDGGEAASHSCRNAQHGPDRLFRFVAVASYQSGTICLDLLP